MQKTRINLAIVAESNFTSSLLETMNRIKSGSVTWKNYDEVFHDDTIRFVTFGPHDEAYQG